MTGLQIPKDPAANLIWRDRILQEAAEDSGLRQELYTACSLSLLFWINGFVFTYRKFVVDPETNLRRNCAGPAESHVPFVTWPIQDEHILKIEDAVDVGYEVLTDKSRDMGATWDQIAVLHHQWTFKPDRSFLEISRKIDCVDTLSTSGEAGSDPGTLLGKHDYINRWLPEWMKPRYHRTKFHMVNLFNHSRIDGETASPTAGSSDRRTAILLDEMAKMEEGEAIKRSTRDVATCRLPNSTPDGPGTAFSKWATGGQIEVFRMMYWDHPEKGLGRYVKLNETTQKWEIRSPWFDNEEKVRTPKELAIEVLADHIGSGETYFEAANVENHRRLFAREPKSCWRVDFHRGMSTEQVKKTVARSQRQYVKAERRAEGPLKIYVGLVDGRLDQTYNYVLSMDISKGQGASNSVIDITCAETREKVGEWADANTPPYDLARVASALALWVGGARRNGRPFTIWEANGPGWDFGRQFVKVYDYPFYYMDEIAGRTGKTKTKKYGWHSTREKKEEALGMLRRAYAHGGFLNHSEKALDEALTYIYYDGGGIGPAELQKESDAARKIHGDRVIADMLALVGLGDSPISKPSEAEPPKQSFAARRRQHTQRRKEQKAHIERDRFDHRHAGVL